MKRPAQRQQTAIAATVVHDVALLAAVFHAPILWGGVAIPETHSPGTFSASVGQALVSSLIAVAVIAALIARWALGRGPARLPNAVHLPAAALLGISAVSAVFSVSPHASALELSRLAVGILLFWLVANRALLPATPSNLVAASFGCSVVFFLLIPVTGEAGAALKVFSVVALGVACAYVVGARRDTDPTGWWTAALICSAALGVALYGLREKVAVLDQLGDETWAIFSTFFNPNPLGGFLAMVFALALSATLAATVLWRWLLWVFCASLLALAVLPTYSKGAWLAFVVSVLCYAILTASQGQRGRRIVARALAAVALIALAAGVLGWRAEPVRTRLTGLIGAQSASNMFRILTWKGTLQLAAAHPWIGVGPSGFKYAYPEYAITGYVEAAHQNYLQMFAELGVVGGAAFLWLLGAALFTARSALRRATDLEGRAWAVGGLCAIVVLLVHSFLDYDWYVGAIGVTFWLVTGMLAHRAQARPVQALAASAEPPRGRRGRARVAAQHTGSLNEEGAAPLPWPRTPVGRLVAFAAVVVFLWVCVSIPVRNALAQKALDRGTASYLSGTSTGQTASLVHYRQATVYDPGWSKAWEQYGIAVGALGGVEAGAEAIQRGAKLEPTNHRLLKSLGSLYKHAGRLEQAADAYRRALERFPSNTKILQELGETYQRMGDGARALRVYQRMVEIERSPYNQYRALESVDVDTTYAHAHYHLGRAAVLAYELGSRPDGLQAGLTEYESSLSVIRAYNEKARATDDMFRKLGRPRAHRGEEMDRLEARVRWRTAAILEKLGDSQRAEEERGRAVSLLPNVARATAIEDGEQPQ